MMEALITIELKMDQHEVLDDILSVLRTTLPYMADTVTIEVTTE